MKIYSSTLLISFTCLFLAACDTSDNYAPVTEIGMTDPIPRSGIHKVQPGETLYAVAWRYGLDYRDVAKHNHVSDEETLHSGESLYVKGDAPIRKQAKPVVVVTNPSPQKTYPFSSNKWVWPVKGKIIESFSKTHKGINFAGYLNEPVYAAAAGKIVYSGDGLRGYGNLIIIKHNNVYLSAYAHNRIILVKEGEWVKQGQEIAKMGNSGSDRVMLHFEIRRGGKPIDPQTLPMV